MQYVTGVWWPSGTIASSLPTRKKLRVQFPAPLDYGDELARALLPTTSYFAISSILVGYFKLPISQQFIRLSLHKATIGTQSPPLEV